MTEKFFWADAIADRIINAEKSKIFGATKSKTAPTRRKQQDFVGEKKGKKIYVCASGIGVSGTLHIGNFRDAITTELVVRALKDKGKKVRFIYSWDDYDRFRKVPMNVPKKFEEYIGMPVSEIPSPQGRGTYAKYFEKQFEKELNKVGIKPEFISQSEMNKKCKYASLIKIALDKKEVITKILNKYRKEPLAKDWYPITIYCEKCKKDFTRIINVDGYFVEYECKCGFRNKIDFRKKGFVKLKWRVDWPARWKYEQVIFEPGGADIGAAGGSYETGKEIAKEIFDYTSPIYIYYEMISSKGIKGRFSGSKGNVLTVDDVLEIYEPEVLRYLFVGTRPNKCFAISFDNDVIKIYEDFDALEKKYYEKKANRQERRIYEMSCLKVRKKKPIRIGFRHLITIIQSGKVSGLNKENKIRAEKVRNWLKKYADDNFKFEVQDKIRIKLNKKEKEALILLKEVLKKKKLDEKKLFGVFYEICKDVDISNKEFFEVCYKVIIGKSKGPRLAGLIFDVGKEKIIKLLEGIK